MRKVVVVDVKILKKEFLNFLEDEDVFGVGKEHWDKFWRQLKKNAQVNDVPDHPDEVEDDAGIDS